MGTPQQTFIHSFTHTPHRQNEVLQDMTTKLNAYKGLIEKLRSELADHPKVKTLLSDTELISASSPEIIEAITPAYANVAMAAPPKQSFGSADSPTRASPISEFTQRTESQVQIEELKRKLLRFDSEKALTKVRCCQHGRRIVEYHRA